MNEIIHSTNNLALIGCGCSIATEPVAEISNFWNITHVSYVYLLFLQSDNSQVIVAIIDNDVDLL